MTHQTESSVLDALAEEISAEGWELTTAPVRVDVGVNKATWRVGDSWLTCVPDTHEETMDRLRSLCAAVAEQAGETFEVPSFLPSRTGDFTPRVGGYAWSLTAHLGGRQPQASSLADMETVASGLASLHRLLRDLPGDLAVSGENSVKLFDEGAALVADPRLEYTTEQRDILARAEVLIRARLDRLTRHPMQLVHGDPSNPNLRLGEAHPPVLTGLLDWDHARVDLVLADVATVAQTVILRSGSSAPLEMLGNVLAAYGDAGGVPFTVDDALTGLLMAKFESVAHHGGRYLRGEGPHDIVMSQPEKIRTVLRLVEDRGVPGR
ncbi:hypothetical protein BJF83_22615 [Nocardiopsis sp. CNR-923]|uniref:phosphotransferase enzyme family protein n=1 Tax=Nocardiopsis sp. CNR-923 TaxID=1904965 RepID=UPI00096400D7|nr:aminoglycoside phosphotransferase family protein [Nocardiopsis sp. CNR-923]OLT25779.1 hypothetical protein BJF83_22615 [Nocardiopsis sp. CNR-923]